jgi:hypothetical protein
MRLRERDVDHKDTAKLDPAEPVVMPEIQACPFARVLNSNHKPLRLLRMANSVPILAEQRWVHCVCGASGPMAETDIEAVEAWNKARR